MNTNKVPIIVIAGPTASGKTALSIRLAGCYNGEIICADSRTVYKGMDVGTAKPTKSEQQKIRHHGLDLIEPDHMFSAGQFKRYAEQKIIDIQSRGKNVFIVGGSGLYIDSLVYDFSLSPIPEIRLREKYQSMSLPELQREADRLGLHLSSQTLNNPRHLSRALERKGDYPKKKKLPKNIYYFGLNINKQELDRRIELRARDMLSRSFPEEVEQLVGRYGRNIPPFQAPGYKAFIDYMDGEINKNDALKKFIQNDRKLAKKQLTWLKKNPDITWVNSQGEAEQQIELIFAKI